MHVTSCLITMLRHLRDRLRILLLPHGEVWQSQRYRAIADTLDTWSFWCTLIINVVVVRSSYRSARRGIFAVVSSRPDGATAVGCQVDVDAAVATVLEALSCHHLDSMRYSAEGLASLLAGVVLPQPPLGAAVEQVRSNSQPATHSVNLATIQ
jgi:hypothetical protein